MRLISGLRYPRIFSPASRKSTACFCARWCTTRSMRIDLILDDPVSEINRGAKVVHLAGGGTIAYAQLILAVGARNRILPVPGAENVLYLRSLDEAVTLRQRLAEARHGVVVIGGGFIGLEVAAAARSAGKTVTVIEAAPRLMARAVSPVLSDFFLDVHRAQGVGSVVELRGGRSAARRCDPRAAGAASLRIWWWRASAWSPMSNWRERRGSKWMTASRWTNFCAQAIRIFSRSAIARHHPRRARARVGAERRRSGQVRGAGDHGQPDAVSRCPLVLDRSV